MLNKIEINWEIDKENQGFIFDIRVPKDMNQDQVISVLKLLIEQLNKGVRK